MKLAVLALLLATVTAYAQPRPDPPPDDSLIDQIRERYENGDYEGARELLLQAYALEPLPNFLFSLGQVEINLGNYAAAIDYYERYLASNPDPEKAALAQQAIGAARMRLAEEKRTKPPDKPTPPPPEQPPERGWTITHTGLAAFGGAAVILGTGLLIYSRSLGNDRSGSLMDYDARVEQARTTRWTGAGILAAGTVLIGVTLLW